MTGRTKNSPLLPGIHNIRTFPAILLMSMAFFTMPGRAQDPGRPEGETFRVVSADTLDIDSTWIGHSPRKAAMFSAVLPGMGQAYNRKYWKIPIVYAGLIGFGYSSYWNSEQYKYYFDRYKFMTENGYGEWEGQTIQEVEWYKDTHLRYKNLFMIITVAFYAIQVVDANVDAHLIDYDISDDLSLQVDPVMLVSPMQGPPIAGLAPGMNAGSFGLRCSLKF